MIISFILIAAFIISTVLFLIFALDLLIRGHEVSTSKKAKKALVKIIRQYKPDANFFYDLGCAYGGLSLFIKRTLPILNVCAIDNSMVRIFFVKLRSKILKLKIDFKKQDIFAVDLCQADIVYAYLWYNLMPPLEKKLQNELKNGSVVITNTSNFPTWQPVYKIVINPEASVVPCPEMLFVYIKK